MEPNLPRICVGFYLTGDDFDLNYVTAKLGILPTNMRERKDFPVSAMAHTSWELETEKEFSKAVCYQFEKLIRELRGKEAIINELFDNLNLEVIFTVVINMENGDGPELVLTKEIIGFVSAINAEVGFDIYVD
ncbi:DUF4279 domain-containing protein [Listeria swaminathanii]|uniref:DUF4279 domain-containing protein n=1 Tax=Listeria swaminathanii TaxID=2713501 RepID=A0ABU2II30_9LIST|nr:DUF4279 domain-containing protein [Listeria swaminathanii]MDT0017144.1 DUF4279 domain-containing protein [Listeria swaminathanii]MDT0023098.1 DUF4279 domain-containing protein [Listeria swaminathanii]MDT0034040.1 DUF4279 domain-containing protein [Listeria swaminathanii]MDT0052863.1 DUF4279 domain-containing protein [Listeria swaminathanii]MDT0055628.1 DUF4279 domain-containing protein [Listeria swaminathanii]